MATVYKTVEAVTMESEEKKRGVTCELLDPIPNKASSEEPKKSPGMQALPAEMTELLKNAEDAQSSCDFAESTSVDRKDIDRASDGEKFLESSSEVAIVKAEDDNQLQRSGTLETDERATDEEKQFQQEKSDQDYGTDDVTSAVSPVAKTVEENFNIIEEQRTEEILDKNVDTGCGPKVDRTDNAADVDPTFVYQNVGENTLDVESNVSEKLLDLPAEQKAPQSLDVCKQTEDEKVEIDKIIQNGARDASIAVVAASSDTPNEDREFTITSDKGDKKPDDSSTIVAADMSMKHGHEVDTVVLKETTSTESQDITESSAEMKHVMAAGENEEHKSNSTGSAVIIEPVAHSPHQIDEEDACHMDVEEANDLTQETVIQVVQNTLAEDEDGMDREENLDGSSAKHVESMQTDYSTPFSTEASEGERHDSGHLTGEMVMDVRGQGLTDARDHIAKEITPVNAESEGSFLQQSPQSNEQPEINTEVLQEAVSCVKEEARSKSCDGGSTQEVDEDKSMDNGRKDENSPLNPEGDQQRSEAAALEIECEKVTGESEACNPKETKTEDGSEACKSTKFQDAGLPSREGHDPEDVATDIAASGDIHCTESVADEIVQPTSEPEIVLETAPTCRTEHESCFGEKDKATEADEYKELEANSCNTTDLTDETVRTAPAEYSDTTQKENEREIKPSEEPETAGADRSLEDDTPQGNESCKMSLQISQPMHGEMTQEVEGKEKGTTVVNLADNSSSITGLDMVTKEASMSEKDSEETVNKNERADAFERSLDWIPEPTEADSTNSPKMGGTILCHEELSAKGTHEDNVKYDQNEIHKSYEQTGRSSTTDGPEDLILLNAGKETGESAGPDLIEEDPIQDRTTEAIAHREDNVMGCQVNPSTEEAVDYTKNITEERNATRDFEVLAEGISEGGPSKEDREEENNEEVQTQLVTFTSCKKTDDCEQEEDAKPKLPPAVDEQEIENQKSKSTSDEISLKEEGKDAKVFTEQVEAAHSVDSTANTEKDNMETCSKIQSTSIDECSEKETLPTECDEYYQSESPCAPPEANSEVNGAAERLEVPSANGSQAARVSATEEGIPTNDNESEAKNRAGSTDTASGVDELPTSAKQERRLENTDSNVKEDDLADSGQEKGEIPATVDAIKESTECEILDKEPKDSKDLGTTENPAVDTLRGSLCSILKTEAGEEECEASAEYEGPDKNEDNLYGTHSTEGVLMPQEDESTRIVSESEEVKNAKGSAQKEVSEDLHISPEVPLAVLNMTEGTYTSATNATEETENQIEVDQHNTISDERSEITHLEMKGIEGETHDEDLKHGESFAPETDIESRTPEEKVSTENDEDNLKEDYVPDKAAFHSEVSPSIGEEMGAADTISSQNLKTVELTEQTETRNMEIEEHSRLGRETCIVGQVEEEMRDQDKEDPIGLVITPMETIKEDTIKELDSGIKRDIAAVEIGQEKVRPQKEQLDDRPNMASGICPDMGPPERTETDHSKQGEEVDGTKCYEISINLPPNSSESDSKSTERELAVVENPTITEEEIDLPSDKKDETRASDVKESTEKENCSSIENTDAEETEKHEETSERLATSATQNGEAAEDGSAPDQTIPRESTLELLTTASVSLLEEKKNGPKTAYEKIAEDNKEEVEMQLNESLQLSSGTVQTDEACFDKKEPHKDGSSKIDSNDSESEKDTPIGQKDGCIHGEEVLKVETQEKESKTTNPDSPGVGDTTAEVSVTTEEASSIVSSKSEIAHEVVPDAQTNESFTRLEDVDLKDMKVEATITDVKPEQECEEAIEANDMSQNVITDEVVLQEQLKTEETQNGEQLETGKGDEKLLLESCEIGEMKNLVPVLEDTQAIDQAEQAQAGNADNEEIQISKIENDDKSISTLKTADATKDIVKQVVKERATLDDFNALTTAAVETAEIGIPPKEASRSSIELEHDEMKGTKVQVVTADVKPEEKCEDAIGENDMSQNGITNEGLPDENKRLEETQNGEQREDGEHDIKISEKKAYICPIPAENTEEIDRDEQAQAGNADKEQIYDKIKDSISVSKTKDSMKDFAEIIKKTDTLDELNATTTAAVETAAETRIPKEEALSDMFRKGEHMHEVTSDVQKNESSVGPEDGEMNAMKVEAVTADVEPAEKCEDGIEEFDTSENAITNEEMTDAHMKAPLLESCTISEKKDFAKALAEVTEATDQIELEKSGLADNEEIQTSESKIDDRRKDCVSISKIEDATKDIEKEIITEAGTTDESNDTTLIAVPETMEIQNATEEASGFVLSKSENMHEVVLDVQANESSKVTQVEEVMADVEPEEKREDASEANTISQNAITSEGVHDSHTKAGGEENETGEGDNALLLGSCKINEKKDFGPVVAEDTEATNQVEEAESENEDNEEIQTTKSKTNDKPEESILVCKTADASKDVGKKITQEVDTSDEFNATTIAAAATEVAMREPQAEESPVGTTTVPPDSVSVQNSNADDFEKIRMVSELSHDSNSAHDETIDGAEKTSTNEKLGLVENEAEPGGTAHQVTVSKTDQRKTVFSEETIADQTLSAKKLESLVQTPVFASLPGGREENIEKVEEDKEGSNQVENVKLELAEEESERRSESSASVDQGNMGTLAKAAADDLETKKHCDIATETADTLKDEILHEEEFIGPGEADEHENLMKEHQVEENCNPNETVAVSPGNCAICEMTDTHMKAPPLESCTISEKKDFGKALAEVTEAIDQFEPEKSGHADNEEIQTSESMTHERLKDCVSVTKIEDETKDVEKENITEAGTTDESNATTLIAVPETMEIQIPTEEASGFVLSKSENAHEVVLDVQANESSMGSEDAETKGTQVEEVMADVKPEEKRENASEANDISQNAITSEGVLDSHTKAGGDENETGEGDNASLLGSCKINEKKDFGPVVAEDTEATDQVEEAESENSDNEEIQTSKSKTDNKPEDSVLVCKTADATKDVGKKIIQEADTPDEFNATTIAAVETEIAMREPQAEETPIGTSTVPPDSVTFQNPNADDFERIGMVSELSHDSNSAHDETIDGAEKASTHEKLGFVETEAEPEGTAHQVTASENDQGKTALSEETIADQSFSAKKLESLVQTPVFASLPGGGEENIEKVENIEGHDKVAGEMELKENLELSFHEKRTDTECLERAETRNPGVTESEISANESTWDTNEYEKEQNTHGEVLEVAPEEKEKETEFANSPLGSIKDKELSGPYEKASDVLFETSKTAQVDMSEVQTVETSEESEGGEIQDVNLETVAISKPAERKEDGIIVENVEQEMQNEQEKADGSEERNKQKIMKDVDSKETHGTMPGNSIINQDMHTGSGSGGEISHCDEQTNAEKLASSSESYATVALEEDNILNGGGIYIAQTKDELEDFDVKKEIKEEAGSCYDETDTAAMTSLRTETSMLAILQDDKPLEVFPADLEGPSPGATEPGLILSSKNIDKENLDETSSASVCQLSDREKENATTQNPHVSESRTNEVGENDSSLFLVEKGGEAVTTDENIGEKSLDGEMAHVNENIISTDITEVCCKKEDSIKHEDTEFEIQASQVTKDTSCEEDKEGSNQVENVKLEPAEEESERRSESSALADKGNMGTLAKAAADDLETGKHCDITTEAADTLKDEILHEEAFIGPGEAKEHENLMKEHQVEENCNPNETVAMSPGNRAICEEADSNAVSKEHLEASYSTEKTKEGNLDVEAMSNSTCDAQIQEVLHQGKTQEEENRGSISPTQHANKDSEKLKDLDNWYDKVDTAPKTSLTSTPSFCMAPEEEKPVDDSGSGFDKEIQKEVEIETSLLKEKFETQLQDRHLATEDENAGRENVTGESPKADGWGRITIASEAAIGSKDPGTDVIDAMEETTAEELDVIGSRSHCLELLHEADATSDQNTSAKALETPVSALLQEEHKDERKRDIQNVHETETVLFSSAAEAKEEIWQKENGQFNPPKVHPRGSETIQDDLTEKYNEWCSVQDEGLEPETQNETKCTDFPSDSGKLVDLTSATESHEQGVCDDLVKSASQVKIQEDFNEPEDTGAEENQVHALARDLQAGEKGEETSKANESSQGENAEGQIVEQLEDIDSRPINQEITEGSCEEDELHREKFVEGKTHNTFHSKANDQYQEDETKLSAVDKDNAPEEFDEVHVERETADKNFINEAEGNITSEGATESEDQSSKTNSGSSTTDAMICDKESSVEKTRKGGDLSLEEAKETDPVLEQIEYTSIAVPEMPVSGEACLSTAPEVIMTERNEDRSPTVKESIVETIQNSEAKNVELGDPLKADLELKATEYGGERTCSSDEKKSEEDMPKDTSLVSLSDLIDKIPEGISPTTDPSSKERRPTDEPDAMPPEEVKRDEHGEEEHERTEPGHDAPVMVEPCKDIVVKAPHKKSHNILSGVSSKVKHSISKVKKAITGKSSHSKAHSPK